MKHFVGFLVFVFAGLFLALFLRNHRDSARDNRPILRVFGPSSFVSQWGPGPWLKQSFEKTCECRVEFVDGSDTAILFQRLKSESRNGADLVVGLDQFDLESALALFDWHTMNPGKVDFMDSVKPGMNRPQFIPYDWGVLAFVLRKSRAQQLPNKLDDLLDPQWRGQISMEDPRTSTPGLQFLSWLIQLRGEAAAFDFLKAFNHQVKTYAVSWSTSYGLFSKDQVKTVFSYTTSPVFHLVEEKDSDVVAVEFGEGHPLQFEYMGIPSLCKNCELAETFAALILSPAGQKIIMEKNYMFPAVTGVTEGTPFANIPPFKTLPMVNLSIAERERLLKKWSSLRRME
jgi:thiamine transport system substrate-binding protein